MKGSGQNISLERKTIKEEGVKCYTLMDLHIATTILRGLLFAGRLLTHGDTLR